MLLAVSQIGTGAFVILFILLMSAILIGAVFLYNALVLQKNTNAKLNKIETEYSSEKEECKKKLKVYENNLQQSIADNDTMLVNVAIKNKKILAESKTLRRNNDTLRSTLEDLNLIVEGKQEDINNLQKELENCLLELKSFKEKESAKAIEKKPKEKVKKS